MREILIIGAGRSSTGLVAFLKDRCVELNSNVVVADYNYSLAEHKAGQSPFFRAIQLDVRKEEQLDKLVAASDIVVSLIPAQLHYLVAKSCIRKNKPLITASYNSPDVQSLHQEASEKGVLILMEMGLDPGIDHMSAKQEIDRIHELGGEIKSFKSFTGGLIAPESDDNPWHYKITWNPRNVVLAGQGAVKFLRDKKFNYIPYQNLFRRVEKVDVPEYGTFEGYANRDSIKYKELYGLKEVETLMRGTLRREGFCEAWDVFVQLGLTDDSYIIEGVENIPFKDFLKAYIPYRNDVNLEQALCEFLSIEPTSAIVDKLRWIGVFSDFKIPVKSGSPAQILQCLLEDKWTLKPDDKDMIVMYHQFEYLLNNESVVEDTSLVIKGENAQLTSMSKTVGLPIGASIELILAGKWKELKGVQLPISKEVYEPVLYRLAQMGVKFVK